MTDRFCEEPKHGGHIIRDEQRWCPTCERHKRGLYRCTNDGCAVTRLSTSVLRRLGTCRECGTGMMESWAGTASARQSTADPERGGALVTTRAASAFHEVETHCPHCGQHVPADLHAPRIVTLDDVVARVADRFGVSEADLLGPRHTLRVARARHVAMVVAYEATLYSMHEIGDHFGRCHTTVIYARARVRHDAELSQEAALLVSEIRRGCNGART